ncbi:MAG: NnrS family protein [Gammaproteobacteria bacterium]
MPRVPEVQRHFAPWRLFFPSALLLAPVNVLVWLTLRHGLVDGPFQVSAAWHGREMLFGYSFAVIAGYLLPAMRLPLVALIWLLWLAGRLLWLVPPATIDPWLELVIGGTFPAVLAALGTRRFLVVKRAQNLVFPLIFVALGVAGLSSYATDASLLPSLGRSTAVLSVYVVALLVMVMGGRAAATATVGALRARGHYVTIPPRPGLEAAGVVGVLALVVLDGSGRSQGAALAALAVAAILALRMKDWHFSRILHDPEVWPLHLGFVWLALGMALIGLERLALVSPPDSGALHALAAGGIGTITLVMMVRVTRQRAGDVPASVAWLQALQLSMALAVLVRVLGGWALPGHRALMLWLSAGAWTMAFGLCGAVLLPAALRPARAGSA